MVETPWDETKFLTETLIKSTRTDAKIKRIFSNQKIENPRKSSKCQFIDIATQSVNELVEKRE